VWSRLEQRLAAHRSASASDALPSDAPTSAGNATCATVVAPSTTSTGRAATSLRRTCPSCAWPLQRGPHHPADPLLVPGGLLCRGVKWTRGVRRRRGPGGGAQILAPARRQIHRPCVLSPPAVHVQSPVSRSTGAPTPDAAAAPAAVCWSTRRDSLREGKSRVARPRDFFRFFGNEILLRYPDAQKPVDGTVVVPAQTLVRSSWYRL